MITLISQMSKRESQRGDLPEVTELVSGRVGT